MGGSQVEYDIRETQVEPKLKVERKRGGEGEYISVGGGRINKKKKKKQNTKKQTTNN